MGLSDPTSGGCQSATFSTLSRVWAQYRACFKTKARDASASAWIYCRDLLSMDIAGFNLSSLVRKVSFDEVSNRQWG
jgi:hypothetical protein